MTTLASVAVLDGVLASIPTPVPDSEYTALGWTQEPQDLLDCSDSFAAKATVDGIHAVSVTVNADAAHPEASAFVELDLGGSAFASGTLDLSTDVGKPQINLAATYPLKAGDEIKVSVEHKIGAEAVFAVAATVTVIATA